MTRADVEETDAATAIAHTIAAKTLFVPIRCMRRTQGVGFGSADDITIRLFSALGERGGNNRTRKHRIESTTIL